MNKEQRLFFLDSGNGNLYKPLLSYKCLVTIEWICSMTDCSELEKS